MTAASTATARPRRPTLKETRHRLAHRLAFVHPVQATFKGKPAVVRLVGQRTQYGGWPIYGATGTRGETDQAEWYRSYRDGRWHISTYLAGQFLWVVAVVDDFGTLVAVPERRPA